MFFRGVLIAGFSFALLVACSSQAPEQSSDASSETMVSEPTHNYSLKEGQDYGYKSGISEEDQKAGKVASEIIMFRYLGVKKDLHVIQMIDNDGSPLTKISCMNPCEFMKFDSGERVEYNADSLGGAVMHDALSGELEVYGTGNAVEKSQL